MKRLAIFLLAVFLGSLTVVGQDDDATRALKERIDRLTRELAERAGQKRARDDLRVGLKIYDVSELCSPVLDSRLEPSNLVPSGYGPPEVEAFESRGPYEVDQIIEIIRQTVEPASWDNLEGADIAPRGTRLLINTLPAIQKKIAGLLSRLGRFLEPQVVVEVVAVPVSAETYALLTARPRELTAEEAQRLFALEPLGSARLSGFDGQQGVSRTGRRYTYLADYDPEIAEGSRTGDPIRAEVFEGCAAEVRAILDRERNGAVLHCRLERTEVERPVRTLETEHGPIDLPAMRLTRVNTSLWAPLDRTVVAGGCTAGKTTCVFLLTARKVTVD